MSLRTVGLFTVQISGPIGAFADRGDSLILPPLELCRGAALAAFLRPRPCAEGPMKPASTIARSGGAIVSEAAAVRHRCYRELATNKSVT